MLACPFSLFLALGPDLAAEAKASRPSTSEEAEEVTRVGAEL